MNKEFNIIKDFNEPAEDDEVDNFEYKIQKNALDALHVKEFEGGQGSRICT